ncbi:phage tail length tape measure family protein [Janthinobacterium lividum]|uniref:phage tail length tape measure family protein n=1 Tax=Janthinobacterium lividum TaxID=29581 RepID=UPI0004472FC5|nr:phage tail length tape measure family protein [Janthinobacterium lividum]EZP39379.1 Phage-related minor tail protein [Janthinobacterium lividum]
MPEITEILIVVNTAEVRAGTQAISDLAAASGEAGYQVQDANTRMRDSEQVMRAQAEAIRAAADASRVLGDESSDASDALFKGMTAVEGFARASLKIGEGGMNADVGKIKDGLGELANVSGLTELAITRLGAGPVLALQMLGEAAAFAASAYVKGQQESDNFSRAMQLTGNSAGVTEGQFNDMVRSVAKLENAGMGEARVALQTLLETGEFTGEAMLSVGAAAVAAAQRTNRPAGEVAANFATMAGGVVNWVDTHAEVYRTLDASQYQHIKTLEEEGKTQEAMIATAKSYNEELKKRGENLSFVGAAMRDINTLQSNVSDSVNGGGRRTTVDDKIVRHDESVELLKATGHTSLDTHEGMGISGKQLEQVLEQMAKARQVLVNQQTQERKVAAAQLATQEKNDAEKEAKKGIDALTKIYAQKISQESVVLEKYNKHVARLNGTPLAVPFAEREKMRASIHAYFKVAPPPPAFGSDDREAKRAGQLQAIQSELRLKTEGFEQSAKLDELYRKGGTLSDEQYFERRQNAIRERGKAEADAYQKQIDVLSAFKAKTPQAVQENKNKIAEAGAAKERVEPKVQAELAQVNEIARQQAAETLKKQEEDAKAKRDKKRADTKAADEQQWKEAADGAKALGDALEKAFGKVGGTIGKVTSALVEHKKAQQDIQRTLANAEEDAQGDKSKEIAAKSKAQLDSTQAQMKGYSDMAGAAAGFFDEQSAGYKALTTVSQMFHAAEVAMTLAELVPKGISAVLSQGSGDPYTAFGRMAAMAAIVAGLGVAIGGGGGGNVDVAKERQKANGTGTVLGDSSAKSDSIARSLAIMEKNSGLGLAHTISMDNSLRKLAAGIGNLANLLARESVATGAGGAAASVQTGTKVLGGTMGVLAGTSAGGLGGAMLGTYLGMGMAAIGGPIGLVLGSVVGAVLGSVVSKLFNTSKTVVDQGITGKAMSLGQIEDIGFTAQSYADVNTKKKALGFTYSNKDKTETAAMSDDVNQQFTMIIVSMGNAIRGAANVMGVAGGDFNARMDSFKVDLGKISLKGLSAEDQQKALETAFSALGDKMADAGVAGLRDFAKIGEGAFETLNRIANDFQQVSDVLFVLGKSFGVTGMAAVKLTEDLIDVAGGLEKLTDGTSYFYENFLSESEKMAPITKSVNDAMGKLGLGGVTTMDGFKAAVLSAADGVAIGKEGSAELYVALLSLAEPFKKAADYAADLTAATSELAEVNKTASDIASERKDMQQQLNELTKTEAQLLAAQRAGVADANRGLFDQIQAVKAVTSAKDALAKAYETESAAAKSALEKSKSWVTTLNGLNSSMALGAQSTLTPEQKYAEARAQFEKTLAAANAGDTTAQSGLSAAEQAFLTASQVVNASDARYAADYARVVEANKEALKWAAAQVDVQQASLDALNAQVSGLIKINDSVLTVAQAIAGLRAAMGGAADLGVQLGNPPVVAALAAMTSPVTAAVFDPVRYSSAANVGSDVLVAEIRGLREDNQAMRMELEGLRADQRAQTGATIQATFESNANAARTVVDGVDKSSRASAWANAVKGEYA